MRRSTPQPDGPGARRRGLSRPKPPRVIVSGDDAEDPSEWDVVVVENEAIDNERAIEIARARHRAVTGLPSLDAQDVANALGQGPDGPAEGANEINDDAFVLPGDSPTVRRVADAPLVGITFDGFEEPGGEPTGQHKVVSRFPTRTGHMMSVIHEDPPAEPEAPTEADLEAEAEAPTTRFPVEGEPVDTELVADLPSSDEAMDDHDPDLDLPADETADDAEPAVWTPEPAPVAAFPEFEEPDPEPAPAEVKLWGSGRAAATDGNVYAPGEVPPDQVEDVENDPYASFPIDPDEFLTEEGADVDVNELDYASVFGPVDAPDVLAPVVAATKSADLDPVEVAAHAPITESPARHRRRKAAAGGAATVGGVMARAKRAKAEEGDQFADLRGPDGHDTFEDLRGPIEAADDEWGWRDEFVDDPTRAIAHDESGFTFDGDGTPIYDGPLLVDQRPRHIREDATPRRGRRELVALGAAALVVIAVAASSKVFNSAERPEFAPTEAATETTGRATIPPSSTTSIFIDPALIPTIPADVVPTTAPTASERPRTTTTVRRTTTTTAPPQTTTTTTAPPETTTTTEATTTTTTTTIPPVE